jgi:hypothetical protein
MPLFGIIRDSPLIYIGQRIGRGIQRAGRVGSGGLSPRVGGVGVSFGQTKIVFRKATLDFTLNSPYGPVGRHLYSRGRIIVAAAKAQVGVDTGRLKNSISMSQSRAPYGQSMTIGSPLSYALAHHEGTRPHIITPDRAQALRFTSGSRVVYSRLVRHPGTKPNKFLADNLYLIR